MQLLDALGLAPRFAAIVAAGAVTDRKPRPEPFPRRRHARGRADGIAERARS